MAYRLSLFGKGSFPWIYTVHEDPLGCVPSKMYCIYLINKSSGCNTSTPSLFPILKKICCIHKNTAVDTINWCLFALQAYKVWSTMESGCCRRCSQWWKVGVSICLSYSRNSYNLFVKQLVCLLSVCRDFSLSQLHVSGLAVYM